MPSIHDILTALGILVTFGVVVVGWLLRLERRQGRFMTRDEHASICLDRERRILSELQTMKETANERQNYTVEHRDRLFRKVTEIGERLAYFQGQMGSPLRQPQSTEGTSHG